MEISLHKRSRRTAWWLLVALAALSVTLVIAPAVLIFPFRYQTPLGVAASYEMQRLAPIVTLALLLPVGWLAGRIAGGLRRKWLSGSVLALLVALPLGAAWFARQNHFEWMFAPIADPAYVKAADASFVGDRDMMIAVSIGDDAVAYPVRQMAYHHLVNDVVGKEPVVSTY
jgi:hypothetical protein